MKSSCLRELEHSGRGRWKDRGLEMEKLCFHLLYLLNNYHVLGTASLGFHIGVPSFLHVFYIVASPINTQHYKFINENSGVWSSFSNPTKGVLWWGVEKPGDMNCNLVLPETIKTWTNHWISLGPDFSYLWCKGIGRYRLAILKLWSICKGSMIPHEVLSVDCTDDCKRM